jgi:hypothetical protein
VREVDKVAVDGNKGKGRVTPRFKATPLLCPPGPAICVDAFDAPGRRGRRSGAEGHVPQAGGVAEFNEERAQLGPTLVKKMTKFQTTERQKLTPYKRGGDGEFFSGSL